MKMLLEALGNKYFLWALITIGALGSLQIKSCQQKENEALVTYNRQVKGQLSDKERELQQANYKLGISSSELMTQKDLAERLKKDKEELDKQFNVFKKYNNLAIKSKDRTIAKLNTQISGGQTDTVFVGNCVSLQDEVEKKSCAIGYSWEDNLLRFKLYDPDIFTKNNETFESEQIFKIYGEVWEQKDGSLQIRRMVLREVHLGDNGEYIPIENGKAEIVDSKFEYHNTPSDPALETSWKDLFKLRIIGVGSIAISPDAGSTKLGLGAELFNWRGFGINTHTVIGFKDIDKIELRLGAAYSPTLFGRDLNVAFGLSVGTVIPDSSSFKSYSISGNILFYINN